MSAPHQLSVGDVVANRYAITAILGYGGSATIYQALDIKDDTTRAIKALNIRLPTYQSANAKPRFMREAAAMSAIRHPNVALVHDFGVLKQGGRPYLVMDVFEGADLADELAARGPMAAERVWPLLLDVLDALGAGHAAGIIHKDLKPSNLFLARNPEGGERLMILDFGLACFRKARRLTMPGFLSGTPAYMPPEYIHHNIVGPAFDVYQMGLVLVEMLTGKPVVDADSARSCFEAHLDGTLDVPEALHQGDFGDVIARALESDHTHRYPDGYAFRAALGAIDPLSVRMA